MRRYALRGQALNDAARARQRLRSAPSDGTTKIARRVGLSETPGDLERPDDDEVAQVGKRRDAVADADLRVGQRVVDRLDQVVLGPSNSRMNVAATRRAPARTWIGGVDTISPSGSDSEIQRSTFSSAARSPSIATSI